MKYTQWITYKGKTFLFVNAAKRPEAEYIEAIQELQTSWLSKPECPVLWDITGTGMTMKTTQVSKEMNQVTDKFFKENKIEKPPTAIVGLSTMARTVADLIGSATQRDYKIFYTSDIESAKEWLFKNS